MRRLRPSAEFRIGMDNTRRTVASTDHSLPHWTYWDGFAKAWRLACSNARDMHHVVIHGKVQHTLHTHNSVTVLRPALSRHNPRSCKSLSTRPHAWIALNAARNVESTGRSYVIDWLRSQRPAEMAVVLRSTELGIHSRIVMPEKQGLRKVAA